MTAGADVRAVTKQSEGRCKGRSGSAAATQSHLIRR